MLADYSVRPLPLLKVVAQRTDRPDSDMARGSPSRGACRWRSGLGRTRCTQRRRSRSLAATYTWAVRVVVRPNQPQSLYLRTGMRPHSIRSRRHRAVARQSANWHRGQPRHPRSRRAARRPPIRLWRSQIRRSRAHADSGSGDTVGSDDGARVAVHSALIARGCAQAHAGRATPAHQHVWPCARLAPTRGGRFLPKWPHKARRSPARAPRRCSAGG